MKKINFKGVLCGFMAGVTTMCTFTVMAQQIQKKIDVSYRNIKIYADGKLVNTNGDNEAFIYNGTTYLPVRAVGEAFNKAVEWDGSTASVYLGTRPTNSSQPTVLLEDLDYFRSTINFKSGSYKDNTGVTHATGILFDYQKEGEVEYLLDGKYSRFSGTVILPYDERNYEGNKAVVKIYGDNKLLYSSPEIKAGFIPSDFNIDISGVLRLKISTENPNYIMSANVTQAAIVNAGFYA